MEGVKYHFFKYRWHPNRYLRLLLFLWSQLLICFKMLQFRKDDVHKGIDQLSGGESARLLLADIILKQPNVLVFDEPTNHLDLEAIEALMEALRDYPGTLILVSHNRHFVSNIATRIIALTGDVIIDYPGSYEAYLEHYGQDYLDRLWHKQQKRLLAT